MIQNILIAFFFVNLIKKQQKEIDKLKEQNKQYQGIEDGTTIIYKSKAKYVR